MILLWPTTFVNTLSDLYWNAGTPGDPRCRSSVRSSSSWRHVRTQRMMTFISGIRVPLNRTRISASAMAASNRAGNLPTSTTGHGRDWRIRTDDVRVLITASTGKRVPASVTVSKKSQASRAAGVRQVQLGSPGWALRAMSSALS